jgi:exosortase B
MDSLKNDSEATKKADLTSATSSFDCFSIGEKLALAAGFLVLYLPTIYDLARIQWVADEQSHGLIIFLLSCWLVYRKLPRIRELQPRPNLPIGFSVFSLGLIFYALGRSQSMIQFESISIIFVFAGLTLLLFGFQALKLIWFPLFFLFFFVPLPGVLVQTLTVPLKVAVSSVVDSLMYGLGYPIARTGVILSIGQYQLMVADACAGLNSIFTLEALGLFYLNITNYESPKRNLLLALLIIPISFCANVVRVIILVLITYYFGDAAGQGYAHDMAGIILFMVGLILILSIDGLLGRFVFNDARTSKKVAQ